VTSLIGIGSRRAGATKVAADGRTAAPYPSSQ
jgi:hypothetical protein